MKRIYTKVPNNKFAFLQLIRTFLNNPVFLWVIVICLGFIIIYDKTLLSEKKLNQSASINILNSTFPNLNFPLSYFPTDSMVWGNASGSGYSYAVFRGDTSYQSYPTQIITLKDFSTVSTQLTPPKTLSSVLVNSRYPELMNENYQKYGVLSTIFLPDQFIVSKDEFDVDNDNQKEIIITLGISGANHPPQSANIIKNGNVIFSVNGFQPFIKPSGTNNGFFVEWHNDNQLSKGACCALGAMKTRFVFLNNGFSPVWEQEIGYIKVGNPESN